MLLTLSLRLLRLRPRPNLRRLNQPANRLRLHPRLNPRRLNLATDRNPLRRSPLRRGNPAGHAGKI